MGTRNLTAVYSDGKYQIAQYGQWDGYPEGQGKIALEFCREHLSDAAGREAFKESLKRVRFATEDEIKAAYDKVKTPKERAANDGFISLETSARFKKLMPALNRDLGAAILEMVLKNRDPELLLADSISFVTDSLFCEWVYVIDLDKDTFEIYIGFNQDPSKAAPRFADIPRESSASPKYANVQPLYTYDLDGLPTVDDFLEAMPVLYKQVRGEDH